MSEKLQQTGELDADYGFDALRLHQALSKGLLHAEREPIPETEEGLYQAFVDNSVVGNVSGAAVAYWRMLRLYTSTYHELLRTGNHPTLADRLAGMSLSMSLLTEEFANPKNNIFEQLESFDHIRGDLVENYPCVTTLPYEELPHHRSRINGFSKIDADTTADAIVSNGWEHGARRFKVVGLGVDSTLPSLAIRQTLDSEYTVPSEWSPIPELPVDRMEFINERARFTQGDVHIALVTSYKEDLDRLELDDTPFSLHYVV